MTTDLLHALRHCVGDRHVLTKAQDRAPFELDWRKRWQGHALAVVQPASTAQVAEAVRLCAQHGVTVVPQGGNTGLVGGGVPDASGRQVLLSLRRMNIVRHIDADNLTLTAEAGCLLQQAQEAARQAGLMFPLSLASEGTCTLGGNLATNAGGTQVLRFGNARDLCLGLEVVTADGLIWDGLSGLRKDNTGYDLKSLFVGSEGTLGIITAATLKLFPAPRGTITALATCTELADALGLLNLARRSLDAELTGFEVMNALSRSLVATHFPSIRQPVPVAPWTVLLELSSTDEDAVARDRLTACLTVASDQGWIHDAVLADNLAQSQGLWHLRESISMAQAAEGLNIKHDIALPVSAIPDFVAHTDAALAAAIPGVRLVNFGHLGDGNLHYNVQAPIGADPARFLVEQEALANRIVYDNVAARGGSISAEHGIGQLKRDTLPTYRSPIALQLMRQVKQALDPQGLMNPGRLL
jgi:FAD/FMN-containing dehydrogenase